MSVRLSDAASYVIAVENAGLSNLDYQNAMQSRLYDIKGDKVLFRTYINDIEFWEFAFKRGDSWIELVYTTYGCVE